MKSVRYFLEPNGLSYVPQAITFAAVNPIKIQNFKKGQQACTCLCNFVRYKNTNN